MLEARPLEIDGELWGTVYTFNKGDRLEAHRHETEHTNHISIITGGPFKLLGEHEGTIVEGKPGGTIINWKVGVLHGFEALEPGTIINIRKL